MPFQFDGSPLGAPSTPPEPSPEAQQGAPRKEDTPQYWLLSKSWAYAQPQARERMVGDQFSKWKSSLEQNKEATVPSVVYRDGKQVTDNVRVFAPDGSYTSQGMDYLERGKQMFEQAAKEQDGGLFKDKYTGRFEPSFSTNQLMEPAAKQRPMFDDYAKFEASLKDAEVVDGKQPSPTWEEYVKFHNQDIKNPEAQLDPSNERMKKAFESQKEVMGFDPSKMPEGKRFMMKNGVPFFDPNHLNDLDSYEKDIASSDLSKADKEIVLLKFKDYINKNAGSLIPAFSQIDQAYSPDGGMANGILSSMGVNMGTLNDKYIEHAEKSNGDVYSFIKDNKEAFNQDRYGLFSKLGAEFWNASRQTGAGLAWLASGGSQWATEMAAANSEYAADNWKAFGEKKLFSAFGRDFTDKGFYELGGQLASMMATAGAGSLVKAGVKGVSAGMALRAGAAAGAKAGAAEVAAKGLTGEAAASAIKLSTEAGKFSAAETLKSTANELAAKAAESAAKLEARGFVAKNLIKAFNDPSMYLGSFQATGSSFGSTYNQVFDMTGDRDKAYREASIQGLSDGLSALIATGIFNRISPGMERVLAGPGGNLDNSLIMNIRSQIAGSAGKKEAINMIEGLALNKELRQGLTSALKKEMGNVARSAGLRGIGMVGEVASEMGEEFSDEALSDVFHAMLDDSQTWNDKVWNNLSENFKDYMQAGIMGAFGGAAGGSLHAGHGALSTMSGKTRQARVNLIKENISDKWATIKANIEKFGEGVHAAQNAAGDTVALPLAEMIQSPEISHDNKVKALVNAAMNGRYASFENATINEQQQSEQDGSGSGVGEQSQSASSQNSGNGQSPQSNGNRQDAGFRGFVETPSADHLSPSEGVVPTSEQIASRIQEVDGKFEVKVGEESKVFASKSEAEQAASDAIVAEAPSSDLRSAQINSFNQVQKALEGDVTPEQRETLENIKHSHQENIVNHNDNGSSNAPRYTINDVEATGATSAIKTNPRFSYEGKGDGGVGAAGGTVAHAIVEKVINGEPVDQQHQVFAQEVSKAINEAKRSDKDIVLSEQLVFDPKNNTAGKVDITVIHEDGTSTNVDLKTIGDNDHQKNPHNNSRAYKANGNVNGQEKASTHEQYSTQDAYYRRAQQSMGMKPSDKSSNVFITRNSDGTFSVKTNGLTGSALVVTNRNFDSNVDEFYPNENVFSRTKNAPKEASSNTSSSDNGKPAEKPEDKPNEKPEDKPNEKPDDAPEGKPEDNPDAEDKPDDKGESDKPDAESKEEVNKSETAPKDPRNSKTFSERLHKKIKEIAPKLNVEISDKRLKDTNGKELRTGGVSASSKGVTIHQDDIADTIAAFLRVSKGDTEKALNDAETYLVGKVITEEITHMLDFGIAMSEGKNATEYLGKLYKIYNSMPKHGNRSGVQTHSALVLAAEKIYGKTWTQLQDYQKAAEINHIILDYKLRGAHADVLDGLFDFDAIKDENTREKVRSGFLGLFQKLINLVSGSIKDKTLPKAAEEHLALLEKAYKEFSGEITEVSAELSSASAPASFNKSDIKDETEPMYGVTDDELNGKPDANGGVWSKMPGLRGTSNVMIYTQSKGKALSMNVDTVVGSVNDENKFFVLTKIRKNDQGLTENVFEVLQMDKVIDSKGKAFKDLGKHGANWNASRLVGISGKVASILRNSTDENGVKFGAEQAREVFKHVLKMVSPDTPMSAIRQKTIGDDEFLRTVLDYVENDDENNPAGLDGGSSIKPVIEVDFARMARELNDIFRDYNSSADESYSSLAAMEVARVMTAWIDEEQIHVLALQTLSAKDLRTFYDEAFQGKNEWLRNELNRTIKERARGMDVEDMVKGKEIIASELIRKIHQYRTSGVSTETQRVEARRLMMAVKAEQGTVLGKGVHVVRELLRRYSEKIRRIFAIRNVIGQLTPHQQQVLARLNADYKAANIQSDVDQIRSKELAVRKEIQSNFRDEAYARISRVGMENTESLMALRDLINAFPNLGASDLIQMDFRNGKVGLHPAARSFAERSDNHDVALIDEAIRKLNESGTLDDVGVDLTHSLFVKDAAREALDFDPSELFSPDKLSNQSALQVLSRILATGPKNVEENSLLIQMDERIDALEKERDQAESGRDQEVLARLRGMDLGRDGEDRAIAMKLARNIGYPVDLASIKQTIRESSLGGGDLLTARSAWLNGLIGRALGMAEESPSELADAFGIAPVDKDYVQAINDAQKARNQFVELHNDTLLQKGSSLTPSQKAAQFEKEAAVEPDPVIAEHLRLKANLERSQIGVDQSVIDKRMAQYNDYQKALADYNRSIKTAADLAIASIGLDSTGFGTQFISSITGKATKVDIEDITPSSDQGEVFGYKLFKNNELNAIKNGESKEVGLPQRHSSTPDGEKTDLQKAQDALYKQVSSNAHHLGEEFYSRFYHALDTFRLPLDFDYRLFSHGAGFDIEPTGYNSFGTPRYPKAKEIFPTFPAFSAFFEINRFRFNELAQKDEKFIRGLIYGGTIKGTDFRSKSTFEKTIAAEDSFSAIVPKMREWLNTISKALGENMVTELAGRQTLVGRVQELLRSDLEEFDKHLKKIEAALENPSDLAYLAKTLFNNDTSIVGSFANINYSLRKANLNVSMTRNALARFNNNFIRNNIKRDASRSGSDASYQSEREGFKDFKDQWVDLATMQNLTFYMDQIHQSGFRITPMSAMDAMAEWEKGQWTGEAREFYSPVRSTHGEITRDSDGNIIKEDRTLVDPQGNERTVNVPARERGSVSASDNAYRRGDKSESGDSGNLFTSGTTLTSRDDVNGSYMAAQNAKQVDQPEQMRRRWMTKQAMFIGATTNAESARQFLSDLLNWDRGDKSINKNQLVNQALRGLFKGVELDADQWAQVRNEFESTNPTMKDAESFLVELLQFKARKEAQAKNSVTIKNRTDESMAVGLVLSHIASSLNSTQNQEGIDRLRENFDGFVTEFERANGVDLMKSKALPKISASNEELEKIAQMLSSQANSGKPFLMSTSLMSNSDMELGFISKNPLVSLLTQVLPDTVIFSPNQQDLNKAEAFSMGPRFIEGYGKMKNILFVPQVEDTSTTDHSRLVTQALEFLSRSETANPARDALRGFAADIRESFSLLSQIDGFVNRQSLNKGEIEDIIQGSKSLSEAEKAVLGIDGLSEEAKDRFKDDLVLYLTQMQEIGDVLRDAELSMNLSRNENFTSGSIDSGAISLFSGKTVVDDILLVSELLNNPRFRDVYSNMVIGSPQVQDNGLSSQAMDAILDGLRKLGLPEVDGNFDEATNRKDGDLNSDSINDDVAQETEASIKAMANSFSDYVDMAWGLLSQDAPENADIKLDRSLFDRTSNVRYRADRINNLIYMANHDSSVDGNLDERFAPIWEAFQKGEISVADTNIINFMSRIVSAAKAIPSKPVVNDNGIEQEPTSFWLAPVMRTPEGTVPRDGGGGKFVTSWINITKPNIHGQLPMTRPYAGNRAQSYNAWTMALLPSVTTQLDNAVNLSNGRTINVEMTPSLLDEVRTLLPDGLFDAEHEMVKKVVAGVYEQREGLAKQLKELSDQLRNLQSAPVSSAEIDADAIDPKSVVNNLVNSLTRMTRNQSRQIPAMVNLIASDLEGLSDGEAYHEIKKNWKGMLKQLEEAPAKLRPAVVEAANRLIASRENMINDDLRQIFLTRADLAIPSDMRMINLGRLFNSDTDMESFTLRLDGLTTNSENSRKQIVNALTALQKKKLGAAFGEKIGNLLTGKPLGTNASVNSKMVDLINDANSKTMSLSQLRNRVREMLSELSREAQEDSDEFEGVDSSGLLTKVLGLLVPDQSIRALANASKNDQQILENGLLQANLQNQLDAVNREIQRMTDFGDAPMGVFPYTREDLNTPVKIGIQFKKFGPDAEGEHGYYTDVTAVQRALTNLFETHAEPIYMKLKGRHDYFMEFNPYKLITESMDVVLTEADVVKDRFRRFEQQLAGEGKKFSPSLEVVDAMWGEGHDLVSVNADNRINRYKRVKNHEARQNIIGQLLKDGDNNTLLLVPTTAREDLAKSFAPDTSKRQIDNALRGIILNAASTSSSNPSVTMDHEFKFDDQYLDQKFDDDRFSLTKGNNLTRRDAAEAFVDRVKVGMQNYLNRNVVRDSSGNIIKGREVDLNDAKNKALMGQVNYFSELVRKIAQAYVGDNASARNQSGLSEETRKEVQNFLENIDNFVYFGGENGLSTAEIENMDVIGLYSKVFAEINGERIMKKLSTGISGDIGEAELALMRVFHHQDARMRRRFDKDFTAYMEAVTLQGYLQYGFDRKTGRNGAKTDYEDTRKALEAATDELGNQWMDHSKAYLVASLNGIVSARDGSIRENLIKWIDSFQGGTNQLMELKRLQDRKYGAVSGFFNAKHADLVSDIDGTKAIAKIILSHFNDDKMDELTTKGLNETDEQAELRAKDEIKQVVDLLMKDSKKSAGIKKYAKALEEVFGDLSDTLDFTRAMMSQKEGEKADKPENQRYKPAIWAKASVISTVPLSFQYATDPNLTKLQIGDSKFIKDPMENVAITDSAFYASTKIANNKKEAKGILRPIQLNGLTAPESLLRDTINRINVAPNYQILRNLIGKEERRNGMAVVSGDPLLLNKELIKQAGGKEYNWRVTLAAVAKEVENDINNDAQIGTYNTQFSKVIQALGTTFIFRSLFSLQQLWNQTAPAVVGILAKELVVGNWRGAAAFMSMLGTVAASTGKSKVPQALGGSTSHDDKVSTFVKNVNPWVHFRGMDGQDVWRNTLRDQIRHGGNPASKWLGFASNELQKLQEKSLDWSIASGERVVSRAIFLHSLMAELNRSGMAKPPQSLKDLMELNEGEIPVYAKEAARIKVSDMMGQSDQAKKSLLFQSHTTSPALHALARSLVRFSNQNASVTSNVSAMLPAAFGADSMMRKEAISNITGTLTQNVMFRLMKIQTLVPMVAFMMFGLGGDDEKRAARRAQALSDKYLKHSDKDNVAVDFIKRFVLGNPKELFSTKKNAEAAIHSAWADLGSQVSMELLTAVPLAGVLNGYSPVSQSLKPIMDKAHESLQQKLAKIPGGAKAYGKDSVNIPRFEDSWIKDLASITAPTSVAHDLIAESTLAGQGLASKNVDLSQVMMLVASEVAGSRELRSSSLKDVRDGVEKSDPKKRNKKK